MTIPANCTACHTAIPDGATQCPGCGKVYGEDNRCQRCHAVAPVKVAGPIYRCVACGAERQRLPGTVVIGGGSALAGGPSMSGEKANALGFRVFGAITLAGGLGVAALLFAVIPGTAGVVLAGVAGITAIALGGGALGASRRASSRANNALRVTKEHKILQLAEENGGYLTATQLARALSMGVREADALLTEMSDGLRVQVEVTSDGILQYHFAEVAGQTAPARRVESRYPGASGEGSEGRRVRVEAAPAVSSEPEPLEPEPLESEPLEPQPTDADLGRLP